MKTFKKMAAQGDFIIIRVDNIPEDLKEMKIENGKVVVAHSETGHDHVMEATHVKAFAKEADGRTVNLYEMFLQVSGPTEIVHNRSFDTHESILVGEGNYMIRRQREYTPEGFRKAQD